METLYVAKEFFNKTIKSKYLDSRTNNTYINRTNKENYIFNSTINGIENSDLNPQQTFNALKKELKSFNPSLLLKPIILIRTKSDIIIDIDESLWESIPEYSLEISSITNSGLNELIKLVVNKLSDL